MINGDRIDSYCYQGRGFKVINTDCLIVDRLGSTIKLFICNTISIQFGFNYNEEDGTLFEDGSRDYDCYKEHERSI